MTDRFGSKAFSFPAMMLLVGGSWITAVVIAEKLEAQESAPAPVEEGFPTSVDLELRSSDVYVFPRTPPEALASEPAHQGGHTMWLVDDLDKIVYPSLTTTTMYWPWNTSYVPTVYTDKETGANWLYYISKTEFLRTDVYFRRLMRTTSLSTNDCQNGCAIPCDPTIDWPPHNIVLMATHYQDWWARQEALFTDGINDASLQQTSTRTNFAEFQNDDRRNPMTSRA